MNTDPSAHIPVLLNEVLEALAPQRGDIAVDCTAGLGGHASAIYTHIQGHENDPRNRECREPIGGLVLCDQDSTNLKSAHDRVQSKQLWQCSPKITAVHGSFAIIPRRLASDAISANLLLADLGFASNQIEDSARGFSFMRDGPLDMRLNPASPITAAELVNTLPARELTQIIREFGEDPSAPRIAEKIVLSRKTRPIQTTSELAEIVRSAIPSKPGGKGSGIHPATRTFQAIRIAVNDELGALGSLLESIRRAAAILSSRKSGPGSGGEGQVCWLAEGARIGIISFHSLEDRMVKQAFQSMVQDGLAEHIGKPPIIATEAEVLANPRSRSAKLRAIRLRSR